MRIPEIDKQHKTLIRLINDLHAAMLRGEGNQAAPAIIAELVRYATEHFAFEERMMEARKYSELESHRREHGKLVEEVLGLQEKLRTRKLGITLDTMRFLKDWLATHILQTDMKYSREFGA